MRHDQLLEEINTVEHPWWMQDALRSVVELHKPEYGDFPDEDVVCLFCSEEREYVIMYPCQTILAIEKELA